MTLGQISAADETEAKERFDKFVGWAEQALATEKDLVFRQAAYSVWVAEVFFPASSAIVKIDLTLPLALQAYQLGQLI